MKTDLNDPELCQKLAPRLAAIASGPVEYLETGQGPAVLALHGAMGGCDQSLILAQTIGGPGYRYIAVSRPGYLGTPLSCGARAAEQGDLLAGLLDQLGLERAGVLAVSGGGPAALQFALRHPARCKGLVLVSTCATKVETPIPFSFKVMKTLARLPWFAQRFKARAEKDLGAVAARSIRDPEVLAATMADPEAWPLFKALMLSTFRQMGRRMKGTENDIAISRSTEHRLEELWAPVLIVHGTLDPMVSFERHARAFQSRLPNAELMAVAGGEHVAIFTHRRAVRAKVGEFMARNLG